MIVTFTISLFSLFSGGSYADGYGRRHGDYGGYGHGYHGEPDQRFYGGIHTIKDMEGTAIDYYLRNVNDLMLIRKFITQ